MYIHITHTYIVCLGVEPLVVGVDDGGLNLSTGCDAVGLGAEGQERAGAAATAKLELGQVVDEEVQRGGHGTQTVFNVPEVQRRLCALVMCSGYVLRLCAPVMCSGYVLRLCALVMCSGYVLWLCAPVMCSGYVLWLSALVMCSGYVLWLCALVTCSGYVLRLRAPVMCSGYVLWLCALVMCSGYVLWLLCIK